MWAVLFTCLVSRAVHIEALVGLDTSSFVNALRRFMAIRGTCKVLRSDRGTNFIGAYNQESTISLKDVKEEISMSDCTWEMNPPRASHFGGVWERKVGSVKKILEQCLLQLGLRSPTRDELTTFLQEAACIINNTPLCPILSDPNEPYPVTPAMLLTLKDCPNPAPPESFTQHDFLAYGPRRWRRIQHLSDNFWYRWRSEYVHHLTQRQKWILPQKNIKVDDVVLLKDERSKRNAWPLARIVEVKYSQDERVRSVTVKSMARGKEPRIYERPISEIILLIAVDQE